MLQRRVAFVTTFVVAAAAGAGYKVAQSDRSTSISIAVTNELRGRDRRCGCQGARPAPSEPGKPMMVPVCSCSRKVTFASVARALPDLGGMPERSAWLAVERRNGPVVSLDTGDLLFPGTTPTEVERPEWRRRAELIVESYDLLGVAAVCPGEVDFALGRDELKAILGRGKLAVVAANLVDARSGAPLFAGHTIVKSAGVTVGVIGIFAPPETPENKAVLDQAGVAARPPQPALAAAVAALQREGCDLVVLLAHAPEPLVRELIRAVPGVDLAFASHAEYSSGEHTHIEGSTAVAQALRGGGAPVVARLTLQPGAHGVVDHLATTEARAWADRLEKQLADQTRARAAAPDEAARQKIDAQIAWTKTKLTETQAASADGHHVVALAAVPLQASDWREGKDPTLMAAINRFKSEVAAPALSANKVAELERGEVFKTEKKCAECHAKQAAVWEKSPHAQAWESLTKAHDDRDPECVRCHSVGFRAAGGFATVDRAVRPMAEHPELSLDFRNVQCEDCHGGRAEHPTRPGVGIHIPGVETCMKCHDPEHDPSFTAERLDEARKRGVILCTRN